MASSSFSTSPCYYVFFLLLTLAANGVYSKGFDHHLLVLQWGPAVAFGAPPLFGLWPQNSTDPYNPPIDCNPSDTLDFNNIAPLISRLRLSWPSLLPSKTDEQFWSHEWLRHGTCSGYTQYEYFDIALNLFAQQDPIQRLAFNGIIPGNYYPLTQIITSYRLTRTQQIWYYPSIKCVFKGTDWRLHEIRLNYTDSIAPLPQDIIPGSRRVGCGSLTRVLY